MLTPLRLPKCYCCDAHVLQVVLFEESQRDFLICNQCLSIIGLWFTNERPLGNEHVFVTHIFARKSKYDVNSELVHIQVPVIQNGKEVFATASFYRLKEKDEELT